MWKKIMGLVLLSGGMVACSHTNKPHLYTDNSIVADFKGYNDATQRFKVANQSYYFDYDSYRVSVEDQSSLKVQIAYLQKNPKARIRLEGNTDERGTREYNIALGWRRAKAVAAYLRDSGISQEQIVLVSFGKEKPVDDGHDEAAYAKNRRVDLIYEIK